MTLLSGRVVDITRDGARRVLDIDTTLKGVAAGLQIFAKGAELMRSATADELDEVCP